MGIKIDPSYFGPSVMKTSYDLTSLVFELEGTRRNLPQIQFSIANPLAPGGRRIFVTYRNGFDGNATLAPEATHS